MKSAEVVVVGGGPAGAAAAITLARAGAHVVLIDKARFPRDKCCGDGLTAAALRELEELGVRPETVQPWQTVDDVWLRSPSGHTVRFPLPRDQGMFAAVSPRASLDAAILDAARAAGAEVHDGCGLVGARTSGDVIELDVEGLGSLAAPYVVGADGMWSPLRHALDAFEPGYLGDWHAFRQYFRDVSPMAGDLWVWFEADLLPGYAWSFPLPDGRANVGFGVQRGSGVTGRQMKAMWPELLGRPHIRAVLGEDAEPEAPHKAWPIPARLDRVSLTTAGGRALFAGDAACATYSLTGEGIAQALSTGKWAAEAILGDGDGGPGARAAPSERGPGARAAPSERGPEAVARRYEATVTAELLPDHRLSALLSRALRHRKGARTAIRVGGSTAWTRRHFARWLFEDYPRAAVRTPRRWRRGMFTAPGAYRN